MDRLKADSERLGQQVARIEREQQRHLESLLRLEREQRELHEAIVALGPHIVKGLTDLLTTARGTLKQRTSSFEMLEVPERTRL